MLNGWKAIAGYLHRDERTAMRWAGERGLPVHRVSGPGRGSVYALTAEIDAWLAAGRMMAATAAAVPIAARPAREPTVAPPPDVVQPARWRTGWLILILGLGLAFVFAGGAALLRQPAQGRTAAAPVFVDGAGEAMFLQATYDWNVRTRASLTRAVQEYAGAIARDPRVPAAYVGLANSYLLLREDGSLSDAAAYPRAEAAVQAAIALSPEMPEAHRALAFIAFWWRHDAATARREFARAIELRPRDPLTHHWFANALLANGEVGAALREIDVAREIDPTATTVLVDRAAILYVAGDRAEGLNSLRLFAREQPDDVGAHRSLAEIALFEGRGDEFLHEAGTVARLRHDTAGLADVARWRTAGPAAAMVEREMARDAVRTADWFRVARLAALQARRDAAGDALAKACAGHQRAAVSAAGDLWLSRVLSPVEVTERCGHVSLLY